ncbi:hypothetical protein [Sphingomonas changbaiensis]|uniref:hypothetical protein n=1 Tax=Sphingomonas changbaiensis TaxID=529705 RepID=UPI000AF6B352|nr:hypothetical protein [Sphingomonas changbaiensis]
MDINSLLAREQVSLLHARFAPAADVRDRHLALAADHGRSLRLTLYPHRRLAFGMLT